MAAVVFLCFSSGFCGWMFSDCYRMVRDRRDRLQKEKEDEERRSQQRLQDRLLAIEAEIKRLS